MIQDAAFARSGEEVVEFCLDFGVVSGGDRAPSATGELLELVIVVLVHGFEIGFRTVCGFLEVRSE